MEDKQKEELRNEILNALFPSKEDDGIEHVDMPYAEFVQKINLLADL
jgi:hypothetical protein